MKNHSGDVTLMAVLMVAMLGAVIIWGHKMMCPMGMTMDMKHDNSMPLIKPGYTYAKDPVCGMAVEISTWSIKSSLNDKTYYFCSKEDKGTFELNPNKYLK